MGYDVKYGARPLKRSIQKLLEDKLAEFSLREKIDDKTIITCDRKNDKIEITIIHS